MKIFRLLAVAFISLAAARAARADLYQIHYASQTYSVNGNGRLAVFVANERLIIANVAQSNSLDSAVLALVYDTVTDALEVVRKDDGSIIQTVMTFSDGETVANNRATHEYRQAFLTLNGESGPNGSVAGPFRIIRNGKGDIIDEQWIGQFQYSLAASSPHPAQVTQGHFIFVKKLHVHA